MLIDVPIVAKFTIHFDLNDIFCFQDEFVVLEDKLEDLFEIVSLNKTRQFVFFCPFDGNNPFEFSIVIM